jgi:hypothetical protein
MTKLVRFDWAMKYLLRNKANFDILEGFLSELLKMDIHIDSVLESEGNKNHADDKFNRVDLLVRTAEGQHIIVEVQCSNQWDYLSRVLYGTSKAVCEHMREGDTYSKIRKVISVSIVFFDLGEGKDYLYRGSTNFKGMHCHDTLHLNAKERDVYGQPNGLILQIPEKIFPEYYIIKVTAFTERVKDKFDEWVYFFKHGKIEKGFIAQGIQSAAHKLDVLQLTESERRKYEKFRESLHDNASWAYMMATTQAEKNAAEEQTKAAEAQTKAAEAQTKAAKARTKAAEEKAKAAKARTKAAEEQAKAAEEQAKAAEEQAKAAEATVEKIVWQLFKKGMSDEDIIEMTDLPMGRVKELRQQYSAA